MESGFRSRRSFFGSAAVKGGLWLYRAIDVIGVLLLAATFLGVLTTSIVVFDLPIPWAILILAAAVGIVFAEGTYEVARDQKDQLDQRVVEVNQHLVDAENQRAALEGQLAQLLEGQTDAAVRVTTRARDVSVRDVDIQGRPGRLVDVSQGAANVRIERLRYRTYGELPGGEKAINLRELASEANRIKGEEFQDFVIQGPAVALFTGCRFIGSNNWFIAPDLDALLWEIPADRPVVWGTIILDDCSFEGCRFVGVGVAGWKEGLEAIASLLQVRPALNP